jgi:hypothetical protein
MKQWAILQSYLILPYYWRTNIKITDANDGLSMRKVQKMDLQAHLNCSADPKNNLESCVNPNLPLPLEEYRELGGLPSKVSATYDPALIRFTTSLWLEFVTKVPLT